MQRQQWLYDPGKRFEFLVAEPVLRWRTCPAEVMRGQLDRLHGVIGLSNVRFGVLPMDAPISTTPQNAFQVYDDTVFVETFVGESVHQGDDAATYTRILARLWDDAVEGEQARRYLVAAAQALGS